MAENTGALETRKDAGDPPQGTTGYWLQEIRAYEKTFDNWTKRSEAITKRYRNEAAESTGISDDPARFQILWSNIQTLQPALYSRLPQPDITRRFKDRDQVARASAEILERASRTETADHGFDGTMRAVVLDYLLTARGQGWVRYVPTYGKQQQDKIFLQADTNEQDQSVAYSRPDGTPLADGQTPQFDNGKPYINDGAPYKPVVSECVEFESIAWRDFGHTPAPKWAKVRAVWRKEMLTRDQCVERFGDKIGKELSLTKSAANVDEQAITDYGDAFKRAEVYEIWDRTTGKVAWISPGYTQGPLDEKDDPLGLEDFFPCPEPLYGTRTTDTLVPVADYDEYRTQAEEIDKLTGRIQALTRALRYNGAYNGAIGDILEGVLSTGDNRMIKVDEWAMLGDRGLQGNLSFVPVKEVADVIVALTAIRSQLKQDLFEVTGISDIVRGQGAAGPKATATEQRIKGQFAGMRIQDRQALVARFARDLVKIGAEIIAEHFSPDTLWDISGWQYSNEARALDYAHKKWIETTSTGQAA